MGVSRFLKKIGREYVDRDATISKKIEDGAKDSEQFLKVLNDTLAYEVDSINQPMAYSIRYQLVNEDGTNYGEELTATINVLGEEEVKENDTEVQVEQRVNKVKEFFEEVWNGIKNIGEFFVKLFKTIAFGWLWDKDGKFDPKWTEWH